MYNEQDHKSYQDSFFNMKDRIDFEIKCGGWKLSPSDDELIAELAHYLFETSDGQIDQWLIENLIREQI